MRFIGVAPVKTDELIIILSKDGLARERLWSNLALGVAVGTLVAATLFFAAVGFRPDIAQAVQTIVQVCRHHLAGCHSRPRLFQAFSARRGFQIEHGITGCACSLGVRCRH